MVHVVKDFSVFTHQIYMWYMLTLACGTCVQILLCIYPSHIYEVHVNKNKDVSVVTLWYMCSKTSLKLPIKHICGTYCQRAFTPWIYIWYKLTRPNKDFFATKSYIYLPIKYKWCMLSNTSGYSSNRYYVYMLTKAKTSLQLPIEYTYGTC